MLLSFRFANHRSFKDEQQLNLTPIYDSHHGEAAEDIAALPVTGVFGANASGKSNLIDALAYMSTLAGRSDREVEPGLDIERLAIKRRPFRLDPDKATQPSSYVVDLLLQDVRYTYGFILDDERIQEEWLYAYPFSRKRTIFHRILDDFKWGEESGRSELREVSGIVAPTALFLSAAARFGRSKDRQNEGEDESYAVMHEVYSALYLGILRLGVANRPYVRESWNWLTEPGRLRLVDELLQAADVGLRSIALVEVEDAAEGRERRAGRARRAEPQLLFVHKGVAGSDFVFDSADESDGTLQFLRLARYATLALDRGWLLLVDEVDASLHPLLTAKLIALFRSRSANPHGAQLMFTSHDATLLGLLDGDEVLRRDEIWFTEKDSDGASTLYPLAEFKPRREGENRQRRYLNGSYGAIPNLSMALFEGALSSRESSEA